MKKAVLSCIAVFILLNPKIGYIRSYTYSILKIEVKGEQLLVLNPVSISRSPCIIGLLFRSP